MSTQTKALLPRLTGLLAAALYLPGLAQKLVGDPNSKWLFEEVGLGDAGRYGSALAEIVVVLALVNPGARMWGALGSLGVVTGALAAHFVTDLGIAIRWPGETEGDPTLFLQGVAIFVLSAITLLLEWRRGRAARPDGEGA